MTGGVCLVKPRSVFDSARRPDIPITAYCRRLQRYICSEENTLRLCILYIVRSKLPPDETNIHRLLLACFVVAHKYLQDYQMPYGLYSKAGGIHVTEIRRLEKQVLKLLDYKLVAQMEHITELEEELARDSAQPESVSRFLRPLVLSSLQEKSFWMLYILTSLFVDQSRRKLRK